MACVRLLSVVTLRFDQKIRPKHSSTGWFALKNVSFWDIEVLELKIRPKHSSTGQTRCERHCRSFVPRVPCGVF